MTLLTSETNSLQMEIVGYQFPYDDDPHDWLNAHFVLTRGDERWDFVDACLMKQEVPELCGWLRKVAAGDYSRLSPRTVDHQPAFELTDDRKCIDVTVGVWKLHLPDGATWVDLEFPIDPEALTRFASGLAEEAERFPTRN
jgi:hypothetical protein